MDPPIPAAPTGSDRVGERDLCGHLVPDRQEQITNRSKGQRRRVRIASIDRFSSRPDFAILAYPVISFGVFAHQGSLHNLLGENPDPALVEELSNEKQVSAQTPPTFLFHTADDPVVPVQNSLMYFAALRTAGIPAELHVFEHGAHGVGLAFYDPVLSKWPDLLATWLRSHGWLTRKER